MEQLNQFFTNDINLVNLLVSLLIGSVLAFILRWHYIKFSQSINNKHKFSSLFIYLILTITLIITLIKTSLALSLGLVGALSIVRFRTPIKESEDLIYLFVAIAIGLGLGAGQAYATIIATVTILIVTAAFQSFVVTSQKNRVMFSVDIDDINDPGTVFEDITKTLKKVLKVLNLVRSEISKNSFTAVFGVSIGSDEELFEATKILNKKYPQIKIVLIDQNEIPLI